MVLTGTHNLCFEQKCENYKNFTSERFHFLVVKFSLYEYLDRRVFVMTVLFCCLLYCAVFPNGSQRQKKVPSDKGELEPESSITETCLFKYIENFTTKKGTFFYKKKIKYFSYFCSYFCSKYRLWYSLESPRRDGSNEYPQSMFWAEIRKLMYTPVNPSFTI